MKSFREVSTQSWHVRAVVSRLRAADLDELRAADPAITTGQIVDRWLALLPHAAFARTYVTSPGGEPAAILQIVPAGGLAGAANLLATDAFRTIGGAVTAHMLAELRAEVIADGFRRLEARVHERHRAARLWLRRLGATVETPIRGLTVDGSAFLQMAWVPNEQEIDDVLLQLPADAAAHPDRVA